MTIAVEVRDHKRKQDATDIEKYLGKYGPSYGLHVNQVVIVAREGFTEAATIKARSVGFKLFTLAEAKQHNWAHLVPTDKKHQISLRMAPHLALVQIEPKIPGVDVRRIMKEGKIRCLGCGKVNGTVMWYADHNLKCHLPQSVKTQLETAIRDNVSGTRDGNFCFRVDWTPKNKVVVLDGKEFPIEKITAHIHGAHHKGELDFKCYDLTDESGEHRVIQHGMGRLGQKEISIVLPDGTRSPQITLDIRDACDKKE